jgi:hypothetical protein
VYRHLVPDSVHLPSPNPYLHGYPPELLAQVLFKGSIFDKKSQLKGVKIARQSKAKLDREIGRHGLDWVS